MQLGQNIGYLHEINIEVNTPEKFVATVHNAQTNIGIKDVHIGIFKGWFNNNNNAYDALITDVNKIVTDRDPGPGKSRPFLVIIIPVPIIFKIQTFC